MNYLDKKQKDSSKKEVELIFQKLTPEKAIGEDGLAGYKEALDYSLLDEDIVNIALTGVYGSGKSSVLESYKKNSGLQFLHISLSQFDKEESEKKDNKTNEAQEKNLEGKILNQLLHQIDAKKIPQTIFRTKKKVKKQSVIFITISVLVAIISMLYLLNITPWIDYLRIIISDIYQLQPFFSAPSKNTMDKIAFVILLSSACYIIYKVIITQINRKIFKGFSFKSSGIQSDIEIFSESDASYFDKFLDDVLYLFTQSNTDVIVFEDIDRFENGGIFEKLKEINTLVNNKISSDRGLSKSRVFPKKKNKLRFMYLLKDDLFLSKDRTKFFDFIIPVVPVITSTNSYEKLKNMLEVNEIYHKFNRNFLQKISLYIDDMRLMKNIYNEFLIYSRRIDIEKLNLNNDELLALITYKNIFPRDFSDLLFNKGFIYDLLDAKKVYVGDCEAKIREQLSNLHKRVEEADIELAASINELMFLYLPYKVKIGSTKERDYFSSSEEFIVAMRTTDETISYVNNNRWCGTTFEEIEIKIEENPDFIKRKENIEYRGEKEKIQKEIADLEVQLESIKNSKIKDIISRDQIEDFAKKRVKDKDYYGNVSENEYFELIVFLVRNGYINEGYPDYLTYFYDNSLRLRDKNFLRSITDEKAMAWNFSLTDQASVKEEILDRMDIFDFARVESLNFELLEYILVTRESDTIQEILDIHFRMIKKYEQNLFIVEAFLHYSKITQKKLIEAILKYNSILFEGIFSSKNFSDEQVSKLSMGLLNYLDSNQFATISPRTISLMKKFINNSTQFLFEFTEVTDNFISNITRISPCFKMVDYSKINEDIAELVFNNKWYEINFNNISNVLSHFFMENNKDTIKHKNYSIIVNLEDKRLLNYIESEEEVDNYVLHYTVFSDGKITDDLMSIYRLINNKNVSVPNSEKYISCLEVNNLDLGKVSYAEDYPAIIKHRKAKANETNILRYFSSQENEWTNELIEFISDENSAFSFDKSKAKEYMDKEEAENFFSKTAYNNDIPNKQYRIIIENIDQIITSLEQEGISDEKIEILIEYKKIDISDLSIQTFRDSYSKYVLKFILKNSTEYIEHVRSMKEYDNTFLRELKSVLLESENLPIEQQKELANLLITRENISIQNNRFSEELKTHILAFGFDDDDLGWICKTYDSQPEPIQIEIYKLVIKHQQLIVNQSVKLSTVLLKRLLNDTDIDLNFKQLILSRNIENVEIEKLCDLFKSLDLIEHATIFNRKEPTFEKNEINENILEYLSKKHIISSKKEVDGRYKVYNRGKRPTKKKS